jgi:hypothetical protein
MESGSQGRVRSSLAAHNAARRSGAGPGSDALLNHNAPPAHIHAYQLDPDRAPEVFGVQVDRDPKTGWSQTTTVPDPLAEVYAEQLADLDAALTLWRYAEQQTPGSTGSRNLLACQCPWRSVPCLGARGGRVPVGGGCVLSWVAAQVVARPLPHHLGPAVFACVARPSICGPPCARHKPTQGTIRPGALAGAPRRLMQPACYPTVLVRRCPQRSGERRERRTNLGTKFRLATAAIVAASVAMVPTAA